MPLIIDAKQIGVYTMIGLKHGAFEFDLKLIRLKMEGLLIVEGKVV